MRSYIIICPCCKASVQNDSDFCETCEFPFNATDKEKSQFIARHIQLKGKIRDTKDATKKAAIVLWIVGGINVLVGLFRLNSDIELGISGFIVGLVFIVFGILARKSNTPFLFILIPTLILLASWILPAIINNEPFLLIKGILWEVLIMVPLISALYRYSESNNQN